MNSDNFIGDYRTKSGSFCFRWHFIRQQNGEIFIYILNAPSYGNRPADGHSTHRYFDKSWRYYYICYEPMPRVMSHAIAVAKGWAERTEAYVLYGEPFPDPL